jgi:hypothetical protein
MSDTEADLKATAEDLAADAAEVHQIEVEKTTLDPASPRVVELSEKSERLIGKMARMARVETALASEAKAGST